MRFGLSLRLRFTYRVFSRWTGLLYFLGPEQWFDWLSAWSLVDFLNFVEEVAKIGILGWLLVGSWGVGWGGGGGGSQGLK